MSNSSTIQPRSDAPQLDIITSKDQRKQAGIDTGYIDLYNDSQLAKYNNEYNYWLWQTQADYNSPANQVARAKEAGLNPNIIAGNVSSGNLSSTPESKANYKSHIFDNKMQAINTGLNMFNTLINSVKDGIDAVSHISGIPSDISSYRKALNSQLSLGNEGRLLDNILKRFEVTRNGVLTSGVSGFFNGVYGSQGAVDDPKDLMNSFWYKTEAAASNRAQATYKKVLEDLRNAKLNGSLLDQKIAVARAQEALMKLQSVYQGYQNDWYSVNKLAPWVTGLAGPIMRVL